MTSTAIVGDVWSGASTTRRPLSSFARRTSSLSACCWALSAKVSAETKARAKANGSATFMGEFLSRREHGIESFLGYFQSGVERARASRGQRRGDRRRHGGLVHGVQLG